MVANLKMVCNHLFFKKIFIAHAPSYFLIFLDNLQLFHPFFKILTRSLLYFLSTFMLFTKSDLNEEAFNQQHAWTYFGRNNLYRL
jgi:hypothetical protein